MVVLIFNVLDLKNYHVNGVYKFDQGITSILCKFREHREKENFSLPVLTMYDMNSNLNY